MIKIISIAISALAILWVSLFSDPASEISVSASVDPHLVPGEDCIVRVTLNKGTASGYAMFQQILPFGLTATPVETMGAKFDAEENVVKFTWADLPDENTITVSYKMQTDPNETKTESVPGSFFYTENNKTIQVDLAPLKLNFSSASQSEAKAEVERKIYALTRESGAYKVELTIHRKTGEYTAQFIDNIPEGYTVTNITTNGAKFMFSGQRASFTWSQLPDEPVFKISYNLNAKSDQYGNPQVTGILIYGADGEAQTSISSASANVTADAGNLSSPDITADPIVAGLAAQEQEKSQLHQPAAAYIPAPQKGIFFKIQIAATRKSPLRTDAYFQSKYQLGQHVDLTEQDGWRKYMIGNFDTYASASDFNLRTREKVPDAFVVAYRNAERIPVREAVSETAKGD